MDNIRVLIIGKTKAYSFPDFARVYGADALLEKDCKDFDITFLLGEPIHGVIPKLQKRVKSYTLYVAKDLNMSAELAKLTACKRASFIARDEIQNFINNNLRNFFPKPYGEKYNMKRLTLCQGFKGKVKWDGNYAMEMDADYGDTFRQVAFLRMYIPFHKGQALDFWFEYDKDDTADVSFELTMFQSRSISQELEHWSFSGDSLNDLVTVEAGDREGYLFMSFSAKGKGKIKIIALHSHYSRRGFGDFIPGGQRHVTKEREEVFTYFDPGDMKPPLNIYFSGYKTKEGFEGYKMMKNLGCPFLLIGEPRLEGGAFYIGSEEYEKIIADKIHECMNFLKFIPRQVVISGISMGSFGAAYYACGLKPGIVLLGKPLMNIGNIALNERLERPGGFPTSLDVLKHMAGGMDENSINALNNRFWDRFEKSDWSNTKFVVSYMIEDDYDRTAYTDLISKMKSFGVEIYGRGLHGRHNDDTNGVFIWFESQHKNILKNDFRRRLEE